MAAEQLPPLSRVDMADKLAKRPHDAPLPAGIVRRSFNVLDVLATLLRVEDQVRNGPEGDARNQLKASLPVLLEHAELASRLLANSIREEFDGK